MEYFHNPDAGFIGYSNRFDYELTDLRQHNVRWLSGMPRRPQKDVADNLVISYIDYFNGIKGEPKFKSKKQENRSFTLVNGNFNDKNGKHEPNGRTKLKGDGTIRVNRVDSKNRQVHLPPFGWIRMRMERELPKDARILSATISCKNDRWYVALQFRTGILPKFKNNKVTGVDVGSRSSRKGGNSIVLSDGTCFPLPAIIEDLEDEVAKKQKDLARKQKVNDKKWQEEHGASVRSKNAKREPTEAEKKVKKEIADLHLRIASIRKDFLHKVSSYIAEHYDYVIVEKLNVKGLSKSNKGTKRKPGKNRGANKAQNRGILRQGWGMFIRMLSYKMRVIEVPAQYTSIDCCQCQNRDTRNRKNELFNCSDTNCDNMSHADWNAAINIMERGIKLMQKEGVTIPTQALQDLKDWKDALGLDLNRIGI